MNLEFNASIFNVNLVFDNKYNYSYKDAPAGYVGVHGKLRWRNERTGRVVLVEIQLHFSSIMDGTFDCPKLYVRDIFERTHFLDKDNPLVSSGNLAQMAVYTFGLDRVYAAHKAASVSP